MSGRPADFAKDLGLIHQIVTKGRDLGLGREWWKRWLNDEMFRDLVEYAFSRPILTAPILSVPLVELADLARLESNIPNYELAAQWDPATDRPGEILPFSLAVCLEAKGEEEVVTNIARWGLRPANATELLSFSKELYHLWRSDGDASAALLIEEDYETHIVALGSKMLRNDPRDTRLGIKITGTRWNRHKRLSTYSPNTNHFFWEDKSGEGVRFLAVPIN